MARKPNSSPAGLLRPIATLACCGWVATAGAQTLPPPQNVVTLSASASTEVNKDWLSIVFSTTKEGADAAAVQAQLRQALETALAEAKKGARPGQLEVQTGAFSLFPRSAPPNPKQAAGGLPGGIAGWQGTTELIVEGRDQQAIAQLTARIQTLSIARVASSLSREARQKVEGEVTARAIESFRARADAVSRIFGFAGWAVREVSVTSDTSQPAPVAYVSRMAVRSAATEEPLPVEAGKATVTVAVSGSVQMK